MRFVGLDLSTKTGLVVMDHEGNILEEKEIVGKTDNVNQMRDLTDRIISEVQKDDIVCVEGFAYASNRGFQLGGIGWIVRLGLADKKIGAGFVVAPGILKKFGGGKGNCDKRHLAVEVQKRWGFFHKSDNVTDAYVLAHIAIACGGFTEHYTKAQIKALEKIEVFHV